MSINKITAERNQRLLMELAGLPGNDICADCKTRQPRWASYNLGIFVCVNCASIHRKMGTHISKVKSLTLDTWTKEQVEFMRSMGNIKSNAHYNSDEVRHPPPTNMIDAERDSDLEKYIRSKYQYKSFVTRSAQVAALLGPSRSAADRLSSTSSRSQALPSSASTSAPSSSSSSSKITAIPSLPSATPVSTSSTVDTLRTQSQIRSVSQPVTAPAISQAQQFRPATQPPQPQPSNPIYNDLAQLQAPSANSSLPLQYASSPTGIQPIHIQTSNQTGLAAANQFSGLSLSPSNPFPSYLAQQQPQQPTGAFAGGAPRSMSLNTGLLSMNMGGLTPSMAGASPSMFQPQPTLGGLSTPAAFIPQNSTPSPSPFTPHSLPPSNLSMQQPFAPLAAHPQRSPMIPNQPMLQGSPMIPTQPMPQGSPMYPAQQFGSIQGSPMFPSQTLGQPQMQMQMGNPFMQNQPQQGQYGTSAQHFLQQMQPHAQQQQQQQQQQQAYGQPSAFGGTGWQQTGYQGQQQWGGM